MGLKPAVFLPFFFPPFFLSSKGICKGILDKFSTHLPGKKGILGCLRKNHQGPREGGTTALHLKLLLLLVWVTSVRPRTFKLKIQPTNGIYFCVDSLPSENRVLLGSPLLFCFCFFVLGGFVCLCNQQHFSSVLKANSVDNQGAGTFLWRLRKTPHIHPPPSPPRECTAPWFSFYWTWKLVKCLKSDQS